jgi:integrase
VTRSYAAKKTVPTKRPRQATEAATEGEHKKPAMTLEELAKLRFADPCSPLAPRTRDHYRRCIRQFSEHLGQPATTGHLERGAVMQWAAATLAEGLSPHTANQRVKQIRAIWEWAAREGLGVGLPPKGLRVKAPRPIPREWSDDELSRLFAAAEKMTGRLGFHLATDYFVALQWWLWSTGERTAATLAITPRMLDLGEHRAYVPGEARKGGEVSIGYYLPPSCSEALQRLTRRLDDDEPIFGGVAVHKAYRRLLIEAGISPSRTNGPQRMRRTVATRIELRGGSPSVWLGHAPRTVAEEHYLDRASIMASQHAAGIWPLDTVGTPRKRWRLFGA